jgi:hypothetical protein
MNNDYSQDTLFGKKVISSIGYNEQEIIRDILFLHANGKDIDCDPTYSTGNFYKKGIQKPKYKFDKFPQLPDVTEGTSDNIPLPDESCEVVMFDPPFVIAGETYKDNIDGSSIISKRFEGFKDFDELKTMYYNSLGEIKRVLKWGGVLIFKCQDVVSSGKNHFSHVLVMNMALQLGYYPKDLFVLFAKNRINSFNGEKWVNQYHARKYHSYFWVFEKQKCKVKY